jgi:hypothetical protein
MISSAPNGFIGRITAITGFLVMAGSGVAENAGAPVSFAREVMAVLSKSGCNMGACHGNTNGKGNLKISLRGEDALGDAARLRKDLHGRLLNVDDPLASFLLRKPTLSASHEGGKRFAEGSLEFETLRRWIAEGATSDVEKQPVLTELDVSPGEQYLYGKDRSVKIVATARFADGATRDVSRWAVYEPSNLVVKVSEDGVVQAQQDGETTVTVRYLHLQKPVRLAFVPERADFTWKPLPVLQPLDSFVDEKLERLRMNASVICDDATYMRRVSCDVLGRPPTAEEAKAFLAESGDTQQKRAKLVDSLIAKREYGELWALRWSDVLRNEEKVADPRGVKIFNNWLRDSLNGDLSLDRLAKSLVTSVGSTYEFPPANYYRVLRDPATRAEATAQVFLGTRLGCAKCHNHPFERWTQTDYYQFSALFDGLEYHALRDGRTDRFDKNEQRGEQVVFRKDEYNFLDPRTKKQPVQAMLGADSPRVKQPEKRFEELAAWLVGHPLFAQVQANRVWYHLMGVGIVDPVDDFRATNPPSNPNLLKHLAETLMQNGYRLKPLVRTILLSRTYQLSSEPNAWNAADTHNFAKGTVRRLPAEQLINAVHQALEGQSDFSGYASGMSAIQMPGVKAYRRNGGNEDDVFLQCFGKPQRLLSSETERNGSTSLAQVFLLTNGKRIDDLLKEEGGVTTTLLKEGAGNAENVAKAAFWKVLGRPMESNEWAALQNSAGDLANDAARVQDLLWALLNTKEFLLRK